MTFAERAEAFRKELDALGKKYDVYVIFDGSNLFDAREVRVPPSLDAFCCLKTETGRTQCKQPNVSNIPKGEAPIGAFVDAILGDDNDRDEP